MGRGRRSRPPLLVNRRPAEPPCGWWSRRTRLVGPQATIYGPPWIPRLRHRHHNDRSVGADRAHRRPTASVKLVIRDLKEGGLAHLPSGDFQRQRRLARLRRGSGCCGQCGRWRYFRGSGRAGSLWKVSRYVQNAVNFWNRTQQALSTTDSPHRAPQPIPACTSPLPPGSGRGSVGLKGEGPPVWGPFLCVLVCVGC